MSLCSDKGKAVTAIEVHLGEGRVWRLRVWIQELYCLGGEPALSQITGVTVGKLQSSRGFSSFSCKMGDNGTHLIKLSQIVNGLTCVRT